MEEMSLKDALLKAGVKTSKTENLRDTPKKLNKKSEKHQQMRNFCEVCELIHPDVERFKHRIPLLDAEWICLSCADKEMVHDKFRVTAQSQFAKEKRYMREYGPTLNPLENQKSGGPRRDGKKPRRKEEGLNQRFQKSRNFNSDKESGNDRNFNRKRRNGKPDGRPNKEKNFNR